jgi:hypothetical protein
MSDEQVEPAADPIADHGGWLGDLSRFWPSMSGTRQLIIAAILLALFVSGVVLAWRQFGPQITSGPAFAIKTEDIVVAPAKPDWIKADVKADVLRDGALKDLNLLDPQLTLRVAQAFGTHSWVKEVRRVSKQHPGRVLVELEYRRPAAMVEVAMEKQSGLLPVDDEGVLLPPDFTEQEAIAYPRVGVGSSMPVSQVGTSWGDARVSGGAKIAAALRDVWKDLKLYRISLAADSDVPRTAEPTFELATRDERDKQNVVLRRGVRIAWGHAPGKEPAGEAHAAQKVARLVQFAKEHGSLEAAAGRQIDLRSGQPIKHDARRRDPGQYR